SHPGSSDTAHPPTQDTTASVETSPYPLPLSAVNTLTAHYPAPSTHPFPSRVSSPSPPKVDSEPPSLLGSCPIPMPRSIVDRPVPKTLAASRPLVDTDSSLGLQTCACLNM